MKTPSPRLLTVLLLGGLALLAQTGCTSAELVRVHPWERAAFTTYPMNPARDPLAVAAAEHVYFSRESASGGRGVGGSGCGCN